MGFDVVFFEGLGILIRWFIEYGCTTNKEKLKELTKDDRNKNIKYSIGSYIVIIFIFFVLQHFNII